MFYHQQRFIPPPPPPPQILDVSQIDYSKISMADFPHPSPGHQFIPNEHVQYVIRAEELEDKWHTELDCLHNELEYLKSLEDCKGFNEEQQAKYDQLTEENNRIKQNIQNMEEEIYNLKPQLKEWQDKLQGLQNSQTTVSTTITQYSNEVTIWKEKFEQANHQCQEVLEQLALSDASYEALTKEMANRKDPNVTITSTRTLRQ